MDNGQGEYAAGQGRVRRLLGFLTGGFLSRRHQTDVTTAEEVLEEMDSVHAVELDEYLDVAAALEESLSDEAEAVADETRIDDEDDIESVAAARRSLFGLIRWRADETGDQGHRTIALQGDVDPVAARQSEAKAHVDGAAEIVIEENAVAYVDEPNRADDASGPDLPEGSNPSEDDQPRTFDDQPEEPSSIPVGEEEGGDGKRNETLEEVIEHLESQVRAEKTLADEAHDGASPADGPASHVEDARSEDRNLPAVIDAEEVPAGEDEDGVAAVQADALPSTADGIAQERGGELKNSEALPAILRTDGTPMPRHRLGEYVYHQGLINETALDAASREQEVTGDRIGQILVANGFLSDKERVKAILATSSERIAQENVSRSRIPSEILDEYNIQISAETEDTIYVSAMRDEDIVERIVREYYGDKQIQFVSFLPSSMNSFIAAMKKSSAIDDATQTKETMLDRILYRALNEGASDIHIIPRRKSYTSMFRLLGVRRLVHEGALDEYKTMIAQIKDKARMDLAERRKPQDGGFQIEYNGKMIDLRVATVPTAEGETCIMRVLDPDRVQPSLGELGITDVDKWRKGFNQQHGLCLICGPTGSGKTTTLNSSIKEMDRFGKAIYTIEDPVEYRIPYVGQVSVNTSVGLNFATAVRAYMRADPDVIVLGEVRDEETARNAIKAADTGHLVLATLHTGSIHGAVSRLKDLGVAPRELRYLLRSVLVQSLVRTTCKHCQGDGCASCKGSGYGGRTVVSECEYFEDYAQVDRIINSTEVEVARTWPTMLEDALKKYRKGVTDLDELYRVFGAAVDVALKREEEAA